MRLIVKGAEPEELSRWKAANAEVPENLAYNALHGAEIRAIRNQMLIEQGHLCAYTMQRINSVDDCHIEHIVPQSQPPRSPERDLDYENMLACFPGRKVPPEWSPKYPYGAEKKGGTFVNDTNFVSPLTHDVEERFTFAADGSVQPRANDAAAIDSVRILGLDHDVLNDLRRAAVEERVLDASLTVEEAEELAAAIRTPSSTGILSEFCIAISQVSAWYTKAIRIANQSD